MQASARTNVVASLSLALVKWETALKLACLVRYSRQQRSRDTIPERVQSTHYNNPANTRLQQ